MKKHWYSLNVVLSRIEIAEYMYTSSGIEYKEGFKDRFNSILKQPIQYLTVSHTYGFLRGENMYSDTFKPFKSWIDNWKNLKSIRFELDEVFPEGYGDMDGVWGQWEYSTFANLVKELLTKYPYFPTYF